MFTFQYIIRQFYMQISLLAWPEGINWVETLNPDERTPSSTSSPEWLAHNADGTLGRIKSRQGGLEGDFSVLARTDWGPNLSVAIPWVEGLWENDDLQNPSLEDWSLELEAAWVSEEELRDEIITSMSEEERRDFESKTPEEQQEYLETQLQNREHRELLDAMIELGIEWLDSENLEEVFWDMSSEEIAEFESLSPDEQTRFMQERFDRWLENTELTLNQTEQRLQEERVTASPQRQAEIDYQVAQVWAARATVRGEWLWNTGFFRWEAARMTPEQLAEFGRTWEQLARYAATCTPSTGEEFKCWQNTWDALNWFYRSIGKPELQINDRPRHGYMWSQMLASRPNDYREVEVSAQDAPPWAIISYAAGPWGSVPFSQYGHVEIALWNGSYYFWQIASSPGWSRRPPTEGQYRVFMPVALWNSEWLSPDASLWVS